MTIPYTGPAIDQASQNPLKDEVDRLEEELNQSAGYATYLDGVLEDYRAKMREQKEEVDRLTKENERLEKQVADLDEALALQAWTRQQTVQLRARYDAAILVLETIAVAAEERSASHADYHAIATAGLQPTKED